MPDLNLQLSDPVTGMVTAVCQMVAEIFKYSAVVRATASDKAQDAQDRITAQAYWDGRAIMQALKIVGEPMKWPPE